MTTGRRQDEVTSLDPDSHTAQRLAHATPEHLHLTTRRCFVGPIPEGWLKSHRKQWYKRHLHLNYSSRATTFSAGKNISHLRRITGLEGPSTSATYSPSFPQPANVDEGDSDDEEGPANGTLGGDAASDATAGIPPARDPAYPPEALGHGLAESTHSGSTISVIPEGKAEATGKTGSTQISNGKARLEEPGDIRQTDNLAVPSATSSQIRDTEDPELRPARSIDASIPSPKISASAAEANSMSSLIRHSVARSSTSADKGDELRNAAPEIDLEEPSGLQKSRRKSTKRVSFSKHTRGGSSGLIRFNSHDRGASMDKMRHKITQMGGKHVLRPYIRGKKRNGAIVKTEKMLVRVERTKQQLPEEYDENASLAVESRTVEKWREFVVTCRESTDARAGLSIQLYKTRKIRDMQPANTRKHSNHEFVLDPKTARINLFSSLDKTVVVSVPWKSGSMIYIMRPRSAANSVEWYTFLRTALGWKRPAELQVHVPDLSVSLVLQNPFHKLEAQRDATARADNQEEVALKAMMEEQAAAQDIIRRCMSMLEGSPEWTNIVESWLRTEKMGLAWKRYDRLEWIHGVNEQRMYGTMAMQRSHDLELRPKLHYPTSVKTTPGSESIERPPTTSDGRPRSASPLSGEQGIQEMQEPPSVEGFLIRLTSQRGRDQFLGKMFYKRLYFSTHDGYLCFCRPAKGIPPSPPKLPMHDMGHIPTAEQIVEQMPLIFGVAPYELTGGKIAWFSSRTPPGVRKAHDQDAYEESMRNVNNLVGADGFINLCEVRQVRPVVRGSTPADQNIDEGDEVDFHQEVSDTRRDDGNVNKFDDDRTFELALTNGLVIRLEAFDKTTKQEWISRLRDLSRYWKMRRAADVDLLKSIRQANLEKLRIDEEIESYLGQFGQKWEVSGAVASPQLYNMCTTTGCRTITLSGQLYQKPRRHSTFRRISVILSCGQLLLYQDSLRTRTGVEVPYIHQNKQTTIQLRDCYIYSGLLTEGDLLSQNQTFDSNHPGRHALPRVYLADSWTSSDEDTMTCFVIWQARKRAWLRAHHEAAGKKGWQFSSVSRLGVPGRSIVFKARSRAERDRWVLGIATEIERLQQVEEIQVVASEEK